MFAGSTSAVIGGHHEMICLFGCMIRMVRQAWPSSARRLAVLKRGLTSLEVVR
jgi:hypothetical protein